MQLCIDLHLYQLQNELYVHFGADVSNISIKDVPGQWADALRQRAARNHRSLQGELMAIIERALQESALTADAANAMPTAGSARGTVVGFDRFGHPIVRHGWKTVEQVAAEMRALYPRPITDAPLGVDIIRADRDSR